MSPALGRTFAPFTVPHIWIRPLTLSASARARAGPATTRTATTAGVHARKVSRGGAGVAPQEEIVNDQRKRDHAAGDEGARRRDGEPAQGLLGRRGGGQSGRAEANQHPEQRVAERSDAE